MNVPISKYHKGLSRIEGKILLPFLFPLLPSEPLSQRN